MDSTSTLILGLALIFTMWGMGLSLVIDDFKRVFNSPKAIFLGLFNQLVLLPIIGFCLLKLIPTNPEVAVGIMLLAACPGGPTSNLLSFLAKADTALSVSLTAFTSVISVFTIPFIVNFGMEQFAGESKMIKLDVLDTIKTMAIVVLIPMFVGMLVNKWKPTFWAKMAKPTRIASAVLLALIIVGIIIKEKEHIVDYFAQAGLLALLLNVCTMILGYISAKTIRLNRKQAAAISIESGIQNGTMALAIAGTLLANTAFGIAPAVYSLIMYVTGGAFIYLFSKNKI
jgi:BASS family bile acid:Na+ symporter